MEMMMEQVTATMEPRIAKIRELNDQLRMTGQGGMTLVTYGIASQPLEVGRAIHHAVAAFSAFTPDNDPHGEHDCAVLRVLDISVIWKIDYYDRQREAMSPDPADPKLTCRVLTIMLSDEY